MLKKYNALFEEMENVAQAINGEYMPSVLTLIEEKGIDGLIMARCQIVQSAEPEPATVAVFTERDPYSNEENYAQSLATVAEAGYLTAVDSTANQYRLTPKGTQLANDILDHIDATGAKVAPLPKPKLQKLVAYLERIRQACIHADVPSTACLQRSLSFDRGERSPLIEQIRRRINDMVAFRDDAHIASWQKYDVSGPAWEAFGHISGQHVFGEAANSAEKLAEKLSFRGFSADDYANHLAPLVERGWVEVNGDEYTITESGEGVRAEAETLTNHYFYQGWDLTEAEADELLALMKELTTAVSPPDNNELYELALDTRAAIGALYAEKLRQAIQDAGLPSWGMSILMHAEAQSPHAITTQTLHAVNPYMKPQLLESQLAETAVASFIHQTDDGYRITPKGEQTLQTLLTLVAEQLNQPVALSAEVLDETAVLLRRISDRLAQANEPDEAPMLDNARHYAPANGTPPLLRIGRHISELAAFRDDVHIASFCKFDVPAYEWEAFSHVWGENIWGDKVNTAVEVAKKLAFRGYSEAEYEAGLQTAVSRGWLTVNGKGVYTLTPTGKAMREESEQETDRLFFTPWQYIAPSELNKLHSRLSSLKSILTSN